ncbi:MAG: hypothetical protein ABI297_01535 [Ginsengibacter sp.]
MRYFFIFIFLCFVIQSRGQKYILFDKTMSQPAFQSDKITASEKSKGFFPVLKKDIPKFIEALDEIAKKLSSKEKVEKLKNYSIGCIEFTGHTFPLAVGERLDYVLISTCDNVKVSMHLVDAKLNNDNNAYYVNTWLKYIRKAVKRK